MYGLIQKHKRLAATVIAVASLSFLFWMFSVADIKQMFGLQRCVAMVEDSCITFREFRYELMRFSNIADNEELRNLIKRQVAYNLINREAVFQKALDMGIVASDKEVVDIIKSDPSFQVDGKFSLDRYREFIEGVGLTPAEYENYLKKRLTIKKLFSFLGYGVYLSDREVEFQRKIMSIRLGGRAYLLSYDSIKTSYKPSEKEMKEYYEKNKDKFVVPASKSFRVWRVTNKEEAHSLYSSIKEGKKPKDGKVYTQDELMDLPADVVDALMSLGEDYSYTLTKSGKEYFVLLLEDVRSKRVKSFEEAKSDVERELVEHRKAELLEKRAFSIKEELLFGKSVKDRSIRFSNSTVEEFVSLFKIEGDDVLRLVFSKDKVFGPYRTQGGYVVLYIENRVFSKEKVENEAELKESLVQAKVDSLANLFLQSVIKNVDVKLNEEYLR